MFFKMKFQKRYMVFVALKILMAKCFHVLATYIVIIVKGFEPCMIVSALKSIPHLAPCFVALFAQLCWRK